jgi:uncharacterized protein YuzE
MTLKVDERADALYLRLDDSRIIESEEVSPGVVLDFNAENQVVGVEILNLSKRSPSVNLRELHSRNGGRISCEAQDAPIVTDEFEGQTPAGDPGRTDDQSASFLGGCCHFDLLLTCTPRTKLRSRRRMDSRCNRVLFPPQNLMSEAYCVAGMLAFGTFEWNCFPGRFDMLHKHR